MAVFLPTPGRVMSWSMSEGISQLKLSLTFRAMPARCLALLFGYDTDFIYARISSSEAAAMSFTVGNLANRAGVTLFTLLSVHCAERITAVIN